MEHQTGKAVNDTGANKGRSLLRGLGSLGGIIALLACYGTLATVALLSVIGITVDVDEGVLVKVISFFLIFALAGMLFSWRKHRNSGPLILTGVAAALLAWTFYGHYNPWLEGGGFVGLLIASVWDLRLKKNICTEGSCC